MVYEDLTEKQIENIHSFMEKANSNALLHFFDDFKDIKRAASNAENRINVSHGLMRNDIPIEYFRKWACHLNLNQPNTIFYYQLEDIKNYKKIAQNKKLTKHIKNIIDIDKNIDEVFLIDIEQKYKNQILFSFVLPCELENKKRGLSGSPSTIRDFYLAYVWLDFESGSLIFSIPQYPNHVSINNRVIKKNQYEQIVNEIFTFFKDNNISFSFTTSSWIIDVLNLITTEYFDHNNPVIYDTMGDLQSREELNTIIKDITNLDNNLINDLTKRRIKKAILDILETELVRNLGPITKEQPFEIFLQEVSKGGTDYKANNKKIAFSSDESREIIKKMIEHGEINSLGLSYKYEAFDYKYKIYYSSDFFALRRLTQSQTKKEVVEDVLHTFSKYKQRVQSKSTSKPVRKTK